MYTIVIAGGSASGKSTLAHELEKQLSPLNVTVIAMDAYYKPESDLPLVTTSNGKTYRDYNCPEAFDLERMKDAIVEARSTADVVIAEGLLTLWDEDIRKQADLRVYADCPADVRIVRRIRRNLTWGLSIKDITDVYLDLVRYRHEQYVEPSKHYADLVVDTLNGTEEAVKTIVNQTLGSPCQGAGKTEGFD